MDELQQRIIEIALQIPGYLGYEAKERRRDMDKHTRLQLASKYDAENTRLARLARSAPMHHAVALENLDQKLERLLARFRTAPRGYAGWFDSAQIVEEDLDALTKFDATLAGGVAQLKSAIDQIAATLKDKLGVEDAIHACAELLDALNTQYDQRENLLASGKKPTLDLFGNLASPLRALEAKPPPPADLEALTHLRLNDALSYDGTDFIVSGKIAYNAGREKFWAFQLQDAQRGCWLRVGPGAEIAVCTEIRLSVPSPLPDAIEHEGTKFVQSVAGAANVTVEGVSGSRRGSVEYGKYGAHAERLWVEDFRQDTRAMLGRTVDASELKVYTR